MSFNPEQAKADNSYPSWLPDDYQPDHQILDHCLFLRSEKARNCIPFLSESNPIVVALKTARLSRVIAAISFDLEEKEMKRRKGQLTSLTVENYIKSILNLIAEIKGVTNTNFPDFLILQIKQILFNCLEFQTNKATLGRTKTEMRARISRYVLYGWLTSEMSTKLTENLNK